MEGALVWRDGQGVGLTRRVAMFFRYAIDLTMLMAQQKTSFYVPRQAQTMELMAVHDVRLSVTIESLTHLALDHFFPMSGFASHEIEQVGASNSADGAETQRDWSGQADSASFLCSV